MWPLPRLLLVCTTLVLLCVMFVASTTYCRSFGAYRLEFSSSIRQLVGLGGLFCQLNVTEQGSLVTTI